VPTQKFEKGSTKHTTKYIFVTGGVISGLGKGISTASIALLLKSAGYRVSVIKADMYLNVDAGTMNPLEHGEVFVTDDGLETDQDLGHYERFLDQDLGRHNYMTLGQVYYDVLNRERSLEYDGKCVEGHIHIPQEIIRKIKEAARKDKAEIMFIEVGGTVGEYQNVMFFEAIRRMKQSDPQNVFLVHLVYLLVPTFLGEMKSKPAQSSIYELYKLGLQPSFVICRSMTKIDNKRRRTIAFNTGIPDEHIIAAPDVKSIYEMPLLFKSQGVDKLFLEELGLKKRQRDLKEWKSMLVKSEGAQKEVKVAIAGKYFTSGDYSLEDAYVCVIEAIKHAAWANNLKPIIQWFDVERFEDKKEAEKIKEELLGYDGVIVPQGWGSRGVEGKLKCVQFVRENKIPFLGLCFGMQMAVIEFARNVTGLEKANSEEVSPRTKHPVIHVMPHQKEYLEKKQYGGTIRLGAWPCKLKAKSIIRKAYEKSGLVGNVVSERHRHRYEVNNRYKRGLAAHGMVFSGTSPDGKLVEAVELPKDMHLFFVGTQFHPEYKSRPLNPHPLFLEFISACKEN
jgi:CTP synthase